MFIADVPYAEKLRNHMVRCVQFALEEDIGSGDITAELIPDDKSIKAEVITRESGVLCGREWADEVFRQVDANVLLKWHKEDGDLLEPSEKLVTINGLAESILTAERTALNFLQTLSGTATTSNRYKNSASDSGVIILDTRKTIPGLRMAQKYAVVAGGCTNHRLGLFDRFLIKENHISACGSISKAVSFARKKDPSKIIEVEVETLAQLDECITSNADIAMLDNFSPEDTSLALQRAKGRISIEVSGNVDLNSVKTIYNSQHPDYISSGDLTKNIQALDLSLRFAL
ncbi:carboxylating nicotinate-nucleotide diphosphorylase [Saccharospirillum salsuginis]|uniref:Probable nicotinate-nucleotide pyrophosphorylase [carboxylating] n=1 Tax=Saccharospirillum salsuginis TaxID=418750 RepID=A0A918KMP0_9GAMM|nr:carboxylating nicotinate-nucleotide diphosphorylase [Saccharospirillum salsuginis]GGX69458.1 nicotinate-nucleotide pyrophosphorylase [carboxylating] [Saccharospirillum salsuginis]